VLARRATVTDCEAASGSWRLYAARAWRAEAARAATASGREGGREVEEGGLTAGDGGSPASWLVARGAEDTRSTDGSPPPPPPPPLRRGAARRGEARRGEVR